MSKNIESIGDVARKLTSDDETKQEVLVRKLMIKPADLNRLKKLVSLYSDELGNSPKEIEILSFFFSKAMSSFLDSGEIEKKIQEIKG